MGVLFKEHLSGERVYSCSGCRTHAADHQEMVSKVRGGDSWVPRLFASPGRARGAPGHAVPAHRGPDNALQAFQGRHGRAYLFSNV
jgi:hypothetical protein